MGSAGSPRVGSQASKTRISAVSMVLLDGGGQLWKKMEALDLKNIWAASISVFNSGYESK